MGQKCSKNTEYFKISQIFHSIIAKKIQKTTLYMRKLKKYKESRRK